jgi:hypothetical protein
MTIRSRLARLERALPDQGSRPRGDENEPLTDEQRADRTGEFLWSGFDLDKRYASPWGRPESHSPTRRPWRGGPGTRRRRRRERRGTARTTSG